VTKLFRKKKYIIERIVKKKNCERIQVFHFLLLLLQIAINKNKAIIE